MLEFAVQQEDYDRAAVLRDSIRQRAQHDPIALNERLAEAVRKEDFTSAVEVRNQLQSLQVLCGWGLGCSGGRRTVGWSCTPRFDSGGPSPWTPRR